MIRKQNERGKVPDNRWSGGRGGRRTGRKRDSVYLGKSNTENNTYFKLNLHAKKGVKEAVKEG